MQNFKAILVNAYDRIVTEVEIPDGLTTIYHALKCDYIEARSVDPNNDIAVYVDEEGRMRHTLGFVLDGFQYFGNGLIVKIDTDTGDCIDYESSKRYPIEWWGVKQNAPSNDKVLH